MLGNGTVSVVCIASVVLWCGGLGAYNTRGVSLPRGRQLGHYQVSQVRTEDAPTLLLS